MKEQLIQIWKCSLQEVIEKLDNGRNGVLFVLENSRKMIGILTDGDFRRAMIKKGKGSLDAT